LANTLDEYIAIWQKSIMTLLEYLTLHEMPPSRLAEKLGVPPTTISRVLKRERKPGLLLMKKIMEATDGQVTPNDFLASMNDDGVAA
jgi:DNA-binding MarR family transcriptional regulator